MDNRGEWAAARRGEDCGGDVMAGGVVVMIFNEAALCCCRVVMGAQVFNTWPIGYRHYLDARTARSGRDVAEFVVRKRGLSF